MSFPRALAMAGLAGACIGLSGAPDELPALGFLGPLFLTGALTVDAGRPLRVGRALLVGMVAATVTNALALYWVVGLLTTFAGFPLIAAVPTAALLWVAQSAAFALACAGSSALASKGLPVWITLPACLVVAASLTPTLFPWRLAGTQVPWTLWVQMAELGGEPLVDLAVALVGCGAAEAARRSSTRRRALPLATAALALLLPLAYGTVRLPAVRAEREAAPRLRVGVVQPDVGILEKHDPALVFTHLHLLQAMTRELEAQGADLVLWPETAYPFRLPRQAAQDSRGSTAVIQRGVRGPILFGSITVDRHGDRYNSAVAMERGGRITGIADKIELLAFGEYVPLWDWLPPLQDRFPRGLVPGKEPRVLGLAGARIAVMNCYEDVLPTYGIRVGRQDPDFLVNLTNDAWFGDTSEPWLHQSVARMRSVETRRDLVRAVNTGVSSHTLATGEDAARTGTFVRAAFLAEVRLLRGVTPWVRFGDLVTPLLAGALLGVALALGRRRGVPT